MTRSSLDARDEPPRVLLLDPDALQRARAGEHSPEEFAAVLEDAERALATRPLTVAAKAIRPPSDDVHDYVSLSIYWWPDPSTPTGLPYIRRDGVRNPEAADSSRFDVSRLSAMVGMVEALSLAWYLTGDERYGAHAAAQLYTWFIQAETRMNPDFRFAQIIPGRDALRGTGIIESRRFTRIVDSVALLRGCAYWGDAEQAELQAWFAEYGFWLQHSPNGQMEADANNNHAVWFDVQLADFALFCGHSDIARQVVSRAASRRIDTHVAPDGSMPRELERRTSLHYSLFTLQAFFELATLGERVNVDHWSHVSPKGASLRSALDYLVPFITAPSSWPRADEATIEPFVEAAAILRRAAEIYPDGPYRDILRSISAGRSPRDLLRLRLGYWPD